jgi:hypothetical protein
MLADGEQMKNKLVVLTRRVESKIVVMAVGR